MLPTAAKPVSLGAARRDNLRDFFENCFSALLKRVCGYDDLEASWLNMVSKPGRELEAQLLVNMLSPQGGTESHQPAQAV